MKNTLLKPLLISMIGMVLPMLMLIFDFPPQPLALFVILINALVFAANTFGLGWKDATGKIIGIGMFLVANGMLWAQASDYL